MSHTDPSATATITPAAPPHAATLSADGTRQMGGSPGSAVHCPSVPGYEILAKLGEGGMADVYLGRDVLLDHRVAIKFIRSVRVTDRVRFLAEAQALASVRHPNVVRVVTFGDAGDTPYLVMEYLAGGSLADRLKAGGRLPIRDAVGLVAKLARAMQAVHDLEVIHRDLKPGNVLFDATAAGGPVWGEPKVADFGLAKRAGGSDLTASHAVLGTPAYMAPEQARGDSRFVGPQADVYALGVTLYECLTGRKPFEAADHLRVLQLVVEGQFPSPRRLRGDIPRDLETVLLGALAHDLDRRYPTAGRLADDLDRVLANQPVSVRPVGRVERAARWAARKPAAALAGVLGLVAVLTAAAGVAFALLWVRADRARADAEGERGKAARALDAAEQAQAGLAAERERLAVWEYGRAMELAHQAWRDHNVSYALVTLAGTDHRFRHWEWAYLRRLTEFESAKYDGHTGVVAAVAYAPDGKRVATAGWDNVVRVWDVATGRVLRTFDKHTSRLWAVRFHPTKDWLLTAEEGGRVYLWRGDTGEVVRAFPKLESARNAAFNGDGSRVVTVGYDKRARVYETDTAAAVCQFAGHTGMVYSAAFSRDSSEVVSVGDDGFARVWDAKTGAAKRSVAAHRGTLWSVAFSPVADEFVVCGDGGFAAVFDAAAMESKAALGGSHPSLWMVAYSPDGRRVAGAGYNSDVVLWEAAGGKQLRRFGGHTEQVWAVAFSPDGKSILSGSGDRTARVWPADEDQASRVVLEAAKPTRRAAYSPDGKLLVVGGQEEQIRLYDAETLALRHTLLELPDGVIDFAFSADGAVFAAVTKTELRLWAAADWGTPPAVGRVKGREFTSVSLDRTGTTAVTGDSTGTVTAWTREGAFSRSFRASTTGVTAALTPDGTTVVTADEAGVAAVWDATSGERRRTLAEGGSRLMFVTVDPTGTWAVTGGRDRVGRVWDVTSGEMRTKLVGHSGDLLWAAFSPDGQRILTAGEDLQGKVWDATRGAEVLALKGGHTAALRSASFSPDGTRVVTTGEDGAVVVWDNRGRK